jgi:hypothetical protein
MREFLSDKNFITTKLLLGAKLLLILALVIFFIPLFVLPFFDHASADDYICGYHLSNKGFWNYQTSIYNNWGGRFSATFIGSMFARNNFLYDHYYFHSLLFILLNALSVFFLLAVLNRYVLKDKLIKKNFVWIGLLFLALQYCSIAEPSTYIFWFSSAITYQLPVILLQLQIALWIILLYNNNAFVKLLLSLLVVMLLFIINGFNELFIVVQAFLLLLIFLSGLKKKFSKVFIVLLLVFFLASALIVLLSPGIQSRTSVIEPKGFFVGITAFGFHVSETLWNIFKNPLTWLVLVLAYLYGSDNSAKFSNLFCIRSFKEKRWLLPVSWVLFLLSSVSIAVFGLKGGIIPDRYINAVVIITLCFLLWLSFTEGVLAKSKSFTINSLQWQLLIFVLCIVGLLANNYIKEGYKSMIIAPLYNNIMNEREAILKNASGKNGTISLETYDTALKTHLQKDYNKSSKTLYDLVQQKPSFIFFNDDLATQYSTEILQAFYKVDSIIVR